MIPFNQNQVSYPYDSTLNNYLINYNNSHHNNYYNNNNFFPHNNHQQTQIIPNNHNYFGMLNIFIIISFEF